MGFINYQRKIISNKAHYWIILTTFLFSALSANGLNLSPLLDEIVLNQKYKNTRLGVIINEIEKRNDCVFFFNSEIIDLNKRVTINTKGLSLKEILDRLFDPNEYKYSIDGRQIYIAKNNKAKSLSPEQTPSIKIVGRVVDEKGEPLVGVSVVEVGTGNATISDVDGGYTISVDPSATLLFSYIGFIPIEVRVSGRNNFNFTLEEDNRMLEEVVVVGYGTQKKATLTGAISLVRSEEITATKNENVLNMLSGKLPGVRITQSSSQPGAYDSNIDIRGMGTPLVVIDGISRSMSEFNRMSPEEIESVSVLKDASAAIYGLRSANGVILVTTKKGVNQNGKIDISYSANFAIQQFLNVPESVGALDYMMLKNEQQWMNFNNYLVKQPAYWSQEAMQPYLEGKPSYNWGDELFRKSTPQQQHNLSINGGSEKIQYFFNLGYMEQEGALKNKSMNYNRWNLRANIDAEITKRVKATLQLGGYIDEKEQPNTALYNIYKFAWIMRPTVPFYANDNPNYLNNDPFMPEGINILAASSTKHQGYINNNRRVFMGTLGLSYDVPGVEGLTAKANYSYDAKFADNKTLKRTYNLYTYDTNTETYNATLKNSPASVQRYYGLNWSTMMQLSLNYAKNFGGHNTTGALFYEENYTTDDGFSAYRELMVNSEYLFAGEEENQRGVGNNLYDRLTKSLIGKFTYDYLGKYLAEFSFRYDGSSRFPENKRWGFFPSVFLGWRLSEESFIKNKIDYLTNLKIRASYGVMGDDSSASNYPSTVVGYNLQNNNLGWFFDNTLVTGVSPTAVPNPNLTWYTSKMFNLGLDFDLWNGKLSGTFEVFRRNRSDLLATSSQVIPGTVGASLPLENLESDQTQGWEISIGHRNTVNEINYFVNAQISATRNKWKDRIENPASNSYDYWRNSLNGRYKNIWWGTEALGQFQDYQQIWEHNTSVGSTTVPGDWYYLDWNEDGVIDGKDQHPIATRDLPVINFGINMGASYKNIDLIINFQGAGGVYTQYGEALIEPLTLDGGALTRFLDRWHPEDINADWFNPNTKWVEGYYPVTGHETGSGTAAVHNASYLRLKTLEIGYSLPQSIISKVGVKNLRFYFNAYNLLTFTSLRDMDPERPSSDGSTYAVNYYSYPNNKTFNFGATIKF